MITAIAHAFGISEGFGMVIRRVSDLDEPGVVNAAKATLGSIAAPSWVGSRKPQQLRECNITII